MIMKVFLRKKILGDILVEYLGNISGKNLRVITGEIFVGGFWREYRPLYFICSYQLANKHFEMKFEIHFEFRASLRKFQDLNFWDATKDDFQPFYYPKLKFCVLLNSLDPFACI
jgi:hypothetical protein